MNVWFPSKYEIKKEVRLDSLKSYSNRIEETIKELKELQEIITNRAAEIVSLNYTHIIQIKRNDYCKPIFYTVDVYKVYDEEHAKVQMKDYKKFGASKAEKVALKEYVKELETKYNIICKVDYDKLKL